MQEKMTLKKVTLKKVIAIMKLNLFVIWFWPLPFGTSKRKMQLMTLFQIVSLLLTAAVIASVIYFLVKNQDNSDFVIKSLLSLFPCGHVIWNILCHLLIYRRLQCVIFETENFCELIEPHEEAIIQREYIDRCANFYGFCIASYYITVFALFMGPVVLDQPLPVLADFPFDVSRQPLRTITYLHQIVVGLQIVAQLSVNGLMAFLIWLASARLTLLIEDLRAITDIYDLIKCIEKHQRLLQYAGEVTLTIRPFALGTMIFSTISLLTFCLIFITGVSLTWKIQFVFLAFSASSEVFMYSWPAEHLIHVSNDIARTIFEIDWYDKSRGFRKNLQMIILRSQKPIIISLPCGLPSLSLRCYASYLSTIFSYFTTMRMMFEEQKADV